MKQKPFHQTKASFLSTAVILLVVCGLCLIFLGIPDMIRNNIQLSRFARNLYQYPLPPNTHVVDKDSNVTLLGNSNHCDFVAELILETSLTRSAIEQYYYGVSLPPARSEYQGVDDFFTTGIHPSIDVKIEFDPEMIDGYLQYKLKILDFGYPPPVLISVVISPKHIVLLCLSLFPPTARRNAPSARAGRPSPLNIPFRIKNPPANFAFAGGFLFGLVGSILVT